MTKELEPCPFCGGEAMLCENLDYSYVYCMRCGCQTNEVGDILDAIEAWNTRYKRTCHDTTPYLSNGLPYPDIFTCSECGAREDGVVKEEGMYCYNCGAMFDGKHIPCGAEVVDD